MHLSKEALKKRNLWLRVHASAKLKKELEDPRVLEIFNSIWEVTNNQ